MSVPKQRSDSLRNRAIVLSAAAQIFAERGTEASVELIAVRANVGVGTVYRHFPSKDALIEAVVEHRLAGLAEMMSNKLRLNERDEVAGFIAKLAHEYVLKHMLVDYLSRGGEGFDLLSLPQMRHFLDAFKRVVEDGREHGVLRADITADDLLAVIVAAAQSPKSDRLIALTVTGLLPPARAPGR